MAAGWELTTALERWARKRSAPLLALDTSSSQAHVAFLSAGPAGKLTEMVLSAQARPSEGLMEALAALFERQALSPSRLGALAVGLGPGSFTGLRVGLASIKGLALAARLPTYGFDSYAARALSAGVGTTWVVGDARRQSVFLAAVEVTADGGHAFLFGPACLAVEAAVLRLQEAQNGSGRPLRLVGDGIQCVREALDGPAFQMAEGPPSAAAGLFSVASRIDAGKDDSLASLAPRYLQDMAVPKPAGTTPPPI